MKNYSNQIKQLSRAMLYLICGLILVTSPTLAGKSTTIDGIVHMSNGDQPSDGRETMKLSELWRAGGEEDEDSIFGVITQVRVDKDLNTYLLDTQLSEVKVYDPSGEMIRTLSREGDGPGEVRTPIDMVFLQDGSLGILQAFPGRVVKVDLAGDPAGDITIGSPEEGGLVVLIDAQSREGQMVLGGTRIAQGTPGSRTTTNFIASFNEAGEELVRYEEGVTTMDFTNLKISEDDQYFPHLRHWAISRDGRIYTAPQRNEYVINVYSQDGELERIIKRQFDVPPRTEEQNANIQAIFEAQTANSPIEIDFKASDNEPVITSIFLDAKDFLWVEHSMSNRDQPDGVMRTYDVFDVSGHLVKQVAIECEGDGSSDGLIFAGESRVLLVKGYIGALRSLSAGGAPIGTSDEEEAPMEVVCFSR